MTTALDRPTHPTVRSIQYLRAVAALMVVFHHSIIQIDVYEQALRQFNVGAAGVDVFFVISGFVIWLVTSERPVGAGEFFAKRVVRVAPIYWLITLAIAVMATLMPSLFRSTQFGATQLLQSLFFIPHHSLGQPGFIYPILVPGWTLNYEMFFYLVFGCLLVVRPLIWFILPLAFGLLVVLGLVFEPQGAIAQTYTSTLLLEFVAGVLLAKAYTDGRLQKLPPAAGLLMVLAGVAGFLLTAQAAVSGPARAFYWGVPGALLVAGVVLLESRGRMFSSRTLHLLGDASYSIYLTHILALGVFRVVWAKAVTLDVNGWQMGGFVVLGVVVCTLAGLVFHLVVEKPLTRFLNRGVARLSWGRGGLKGATPPG
ncbi:MAG: acyltransferase [Hydrogenophaga sp.]|nr:acyltransferase [Hydrogenophaga sp.]